MADPFDPLKAPSGILSPPLRIQPGDVVRLQCDHNTTTRDVCTVGGEELEYEMCLGMMSVYPATALLQGTTYASSYLMQMSDPREAWAAVHPGHPERWPDWVRRLPEPPGVKGSLRLPPSGEDDLFSYPNASVWRHSSVSGFNPC